MKANGNKTDSQLAMQAMKRAASKVLNQAVKDNESIPLWEGEKIVWKVPKEEAQQMAAADSIREAAEQ